MPDATLAVELATPGEDALPQGNDASPSKIPVVPVPPDAPAMHFRHPVHGEPSEIWPYRNSDGDLIGYFCRWDFRKPDGTHDKTFLPVCFCDLGDGSRAWRSSGFPEPRPLYWLPEILERPDASVLVTEGEKASDAAAPMFADMVTTTPPHGAMSPGKADWSPMRGRKVVIWPDHDEPGRKFAEAVAALAYEAGAISVHIVDVPENFPAKWDLADLLPEGWTDDHLRNLLTEAKPVSIDDLTGDSEEIEAGSSVAAIDEAEDIVDPLDGLADRAAADPGAPFTPEVLERLSALKKDDRAAFEALRAQLKKAGARVTALDDAIAEENGDVSGRGPSQADILVDLAEAVELFHTPDGAAYADIEVNGHRETWPVRSKGFKRWLARQYYEETDGAPSSEALHSALNVIEAKAHFDAPARPIFNRVGGHEENLYLDLGDETWRAIEIDTCDWRVIDRPPVRFRRAAGMQPLPVPLRDGSVETLRSFLNVRSDADFVLVVAWALAVLRNKGPYPVIVLAGEQGTAKSTFSAILRALLDPNTAPLRALPREIRDLFIAATNGHVLAFDNVSGLSAWISDTLCRLATGGGFAVRQLYTDQDEVLFDATRPVILNGIEDIVTRPDLADRAIFLTLEPIPEERRRTEAELWAAFEAERPRILGALLDAVVQGLNMLPQTTLEKLPRMADFALWATACEEAFSGEGTFWDEGSFLRAYAGNRDEAVENVIEGDPVAAAVRAVMTARLDWSGTATELLDALADVAGDRIAKSKTWPSGPRALSGSLRRASTFLRKIGIEIDYTKEGRGRTRVIHITATGTSTVQDSEGLFASAPSASSAGVSNGNGNNEIANSTMRTVDGVADANGEPADSATVRKNVSEPGVADAADGADAKIPFQSGG